MNSVIWLRQKRKRIGKNYMPKFRASSFMPDLVQALDPLLPAGGGIPFATGVIQFCEKDLLPYLCVGDRSDNTNSTTITNLCNERKPIEKDPDGGQTIKAVHGETDWKRTAIESIKTYPSLVGSSDADQAIVAKSWSKTLNLLADGSVLGKSEAREGLHRVNDRFAKLLPLEDDMLGQNQPDDHERQVEHEAGTMASDASPESRK